MNAQFKPHDRTYWYSGAYIRYCRRLALLGTLTLYAVLLPPMWRSGEEPFAWALLLLAAGTLLGVLCLVFTRKALASFRVELTEDYLISHHAAHVPLKFVTGIALVCRRDGIPAHITLSSGKYKRRLFGYERLEDLSAAIAARCPSATLTKHTQSWPPPPVFPMQWWAVLGGGALGGLVMAALLRTEFHMLVVLGWLTISAAPLYYHSRWHPLRASRLDLERANTTANSPELTNESDTSAPEIWR